jgi:YVTN family beta-propeller protein
MKKVIFLSACIIGVALLFSSCQMDDSMDNTDSTPISYDAVYVVNGESNSISVINLETNKVEKNIDLANLESMGNGMMDMNMDNMWPHHIYLSPDKSKLAIAAPGMDFSSGHNMMAETDTTTSTTDEHSAHHGGSTSGNTSTSMQMQGKILILDAVSGKLLKELTLDGMTHNAVFSPDGKELWAALMMPEGKVKVYDANTYTLLNSITVGQMPAEVTFSDDGKKAFVANGMSNSVTIIDAVTKQVIDTISTGEEPVGAWPGMDGMMYVDNEEGQSISIINSMTNMMTDTVHLGFMPGMAARNAMMNQMWVSDPENSKIHFWTKTDTGFVYGGAVNVGSGAHALAFTKDGETCYVTNQNEGTVSVVDVSAKSEILRISVGVKPNGIVIRYK